MASATVATPRLASYKRAGIDLPVARINKAMRRHARGLKARLSTAVILSASLDFLIKEVIDLALAQAEKRYLNAKSGEAVPARIRITPRHIMLAKEEDEGLRQLIGREHEINGAGVYPLETHTARIRALRLREKNKLIKQEKERKKAKRDAEAVATQAASGKRKDASAASQAAKPKKKAAAAAAAEPAAAPAKKKKAAAVAAAVPAPPKKKKAPTAAAIAASQEAEEDPMEVTDPAAEEEEVAAEEEAALAEEEEVAEEGEEEAAAEEEEAAAE